MAKQTKKVEEEDRVLSKDWSRLLNDIKINWDKYRWIAAAIVAIFGAGFWVGGFLERMSHKFELSDLKTKHSEEIRRIAEEYQKNEMEAMRAVQRDLIKVVIDRKEENTNEK